MTKITTTLLLALLLATSVQAGGYRVATQGQKALAMGHTGVAMSESAEVVFFNPGAMTQLEADRDFTGGIFLLASETEYLNEDTRVEAETDNPLGTPLNVYYTSRISDELSWGFGIYTPYGNKVEWPTDWAGSHLINEIELTSIFFSADHRLPDQRVDQYRFRAGPGHRRGRLQPQPDDVVDR